MEGRFMKKFIYAPLLLLAACNVSQQNVDAARAAYDAAFLTPAAHYRQLGYCASGTVATLAKPCADRAIVAKLRAEDQAVQAAINDLQAQINSGNTTGAMAAFQLLQTAIQTAETTAATLGVK
jgi:hypothetical protein